MDLATLVRVLTWGLVTGSVYMLLATGITLIFGVMKLVNFAHGELMMIGAFITFILAHAAGFNPYVAIFVSMAAVGLLGVVIERFGFRLLRGGEKINEVFFSIALILILQNALARVFVPRFREHVQIRTPYATEVVDLGLIKLRYDFVVLLVLAWAIVGGLWVVLHRTRLGRDVRATSQNRVGAMLMGIRAERMDMLTFGIGAALAALAGSLYGIVNPFSPYTGTLPSIKAFAVIILGGLGSVRGAVIGGLLYGFIESAATFFLGGSWRDATAFVLLILVLLTRPQGLFREGT
ncbi:MAG TPA: branched-chain amino acid ABC transporter permease [Methylomirabilota bacterium]|jgi:branched-chain amino acid transport system permease protein|nr:branched-chain amino acid ABC transporter permease [Methylomirabilota bacterium]